MSKKLYITRKISDGNGRLEYYLTEKSGGDDKEVKVFGVEVRKIGAEDGGVGVQRVDGLSACRESVLEMICLLSDMEVMPVGLCDVLEDLVEEDFFILREKTA
ncbi:MAG: hypothetical protein IKW02_02090 [Clostridia bacterium]|nr:hypothetical protein [Clostridia bacterium]